MANQTLKLFQFQSDLKAFAAQVKKDVAQQVVETATELFVKIVARTPVDTGRARSSWNISVNTPDLQTNPEGSYPRYHEATDAGIEAELKARETLVGLKEGGRLVPIYISNALDYISELERGTSTQRPVGWVKDTVVEVENETRVR